ncbi:MAG: TPR repeat-containing protein [Candidatus Saccharicenans subterraneus]|uniref:TPR repeat-containing protein n=1 Tax=Candidatus Saccharicenans subterraneus TaxID=2508984 RepID=A0A3E2BJ67_9BACT|nr:MAG: TPR repeat-containing protein [Candidatus Saccharicenans subterraneum]
MNQPVASPGEIREISIRLAADEELEARLVSRERVEGLLREVSREFEKLFDLRFRWQGWDRWQSPDEARSLEELAEDLDRAELKRGADILIAVTAQPDLELEYTGFSLFRVGTVVVIYTPDRYKLKKLLLHELGHVFGAVHIPLASSIMSCGGEGQTFDRDNQEIIRLGRQRHFRPFGFPFPESTRGELEKIYLGIRQRILNDKEIKRLFGGKVPASRLPFPAQKRAICLADCSLMLAQLQLEKGEYGRAVEYCDEALVMSPGSYEALNLKAIALRRASRVDEAIQLYQRILKDRPGQVRVLYNLGIAYGRQNRLAEAEKIYLEVLRARPDFIEAHNNLGEIYLRQDRLPEAEREFQKAVELHGEFALAYANLAEVYLKQKDLTRAADCVEKALALDPGMTAAYNMKGNILRQSGQLEEAINYYKKALARNPKNEKALYNLGLVASDLKRRDEAREYFLKAIGADPLFAEAYAGLGLSYLQEKNWDEAIRNFERARELGHGSPALYVNLSFAHLARKDWKEAEKAAGEALRLQPDLAVAFNNLGIALAQQNRLNEAREALNRSLEINPLDRDTVLNLAAVEYSLANDERALELFLKAVALNPQHPGNGPIYNNLAVIYYRRGQYEQSWEFCLKALQSGFRVDPNFVDELRKKVKK